MHTTLCVAGRAQHRLLLPILGLCSALTASPSDLEDQAPFLGEVWSSHLAQGLPAEELCWSSCALRIDAAGSPFPNTLPTYPLSSVPLGWVCLQAPRRWAQPQRENSVTFYEYHHRKKTSCPRVQMWGICGQLEGEWRLPCSLHLQAHPCWMWPVLPFVTLAPMTTKSLPIGHREVDMWKTDHFPCCREVRQSNLTSASPWVMWTWLAEVWKSKLLIGLPRALWVSFMKL